MTFSNNNNSNTYKGLVGISPEGVITFLSSLFPVSILDKELNRQCGILNLLEPRDSLMADHGFNIKKDLLLKGVHLNVPLVLYGKVEFCGTELIETRRIAYLRTQVEQAKERIKNFYVFDRPLPASFTDIANRMFFFCCVLSNFQPPLCT